MSDLIERYGYERAVRELKAMDDRAIWMISSCLKYREEVRKECLEYRRANNIFEVGDYILTNDDASDGKVYEIEKNHFNKHFKIRSKDGFRYCRIWRIERHATDEEIQAGRRLSKIKCWSCDKEMSHSDRAENDGFCIHCNAEIEL